MILKVLGTGSKGNCYLLQTDGETLVLDAGIGFKDIKIGLDFDLSCVAGVIVSHAHLDHLKSAKDFIKYGIDVWQPFLEEKKIQKRNFGNFKVQCFDVPHDNCENRGFIVEYKGKKLLYATDFEYIKYSFKKMSLHHILIECNYQQGLVDRDLPQYEHKIRGHCSLSTCKEFIKVNATDSLQTVILCHLGRETAEPQECINEIQKIVPWANVCVAERGLEVELRKKGECPF